MGESVIIQADDALADGANCLTHAACRREGEAPAEPRTGRSREGEAPAEPRIGVRLSGSFALPLRPLSSYHKNQQLDKMSP